MGVMTGGRGQVEAFFSAMTDLEDLLASCPPCPPFPTALTSVAVLLCCACAWAGIEGHAEARAPWQSDTASQSQTHSR
eukprot:1737169-Rhodomonas_salina.1